jgi:hypothetical protein
MVYSLMENLFRTNLKRILVNVSLLVFVKVVGTAGVKDYELPLNNEQYCPEYLYSCL